MNNFNSFEYKFINIYKLLTSLLPNLKMSNGALTMVTQSYQSIRLQFPGKT